MLHRASTTPSRCFYPWLPVRTLFLPSSADPKGRRSLLSALSILETSSVAAIGCVFGRHQSFVPFVLISPAGFGQHALNHPLFAPRTHSKAPASCSSWGWENAAIPCAGCILNLGQMLRFMPSFNRQSCSYEDFLFVYVAPQSAFQCPAIPESMSSSLPRYSSSA